MIRQMMDFTSVSETGSGVTANELRHVSANALLSRFDSRARLMTSDGYQQLCTVAKIVNHFACPAGHHGKTRTLFNPHYIINSHHVKRLHFIPAILRNDGRGLVPHVVDYDFILPQRDMPHPSTNPKPLTHISIISPKNSQPQTNKSQRDEATGILPCTRPFMLHKTITHTSIWQRQQCASGNKTNKASARFY